MSAQTSGTESSVVLVKALPQPSEKYAETVCVAGLTRDGQWRRLYPVRFRQLRDAFSRWQWIEYRWQRPSGDRRSESRNIDGDSIKPLWLLRKAEHTPFLAPHIRKSTDEAAKLKESLTIIRPTDVKFLWRQKTDQELAEERTLYANASKQISFLDGDKDLKSLEPCPYKFFFRYKSADGKPHENFCHDWETSAAFHKLEKKYGVDGALTHLNREYNERYPKAGMAFAMGTHSQRPEQWLLIGVLRLDEDQQGQLGL